MPAAPVATRAVTPVQGVDFSGTNVQEEGVDEPDLVKTDGKTLFALGNGSLRAVDVSGLRPRLLDSLALDRSSGHELLLHGDRLLVLSRGGYWIEPLPAATTRIAPYQPAKSVLTEVDVSEPSRLRLVRTLTLDGSYVAARLVGSSVRIVAAAQIPAALPFKTPDNGRRRRSRRPSRRTGPPSPARRSPAGCRPTGSSGRARRPARRGRSSSAGTSAPGLFSGSACSPSSPSTWRRGCSRSTRPR